MFDQLIRRWWIVAFRGLVAVAFGVAVGATVATGVGLFVALPAVVAYNVVQKKIGDVESAAAGLGKLITAAIKAAAAPEG